MTLRLLRCRFRSLFCWPMLSYSTGQPWLERRCLGGLWQRTLLSAVGTAEKCHARTSASAMRSLIHEFEIRQLPRLVEERLKRTIETVKRGGADAAPAMSSAAQHSLRQRIGAQLEAVDLGPVLLAAFDVEHRSREVGRP